MKRNLFIIALGLVVGLVAGCVSTGGALPPVAGQDSGFAEPRMSSGNAER